MERSSALGTVPPTDASASTAQNAPAKRVHARYSCDLCKIRKTRCELPPADPSSSNGRLSVERSCHRCRVLNLECVVNLAPRKRRKRTVPEDRGSDPSGSWQARPTQDIAGPSPVPAQASSLDFDPSFRISTPDDAQWSADPPANPLPPLPDTSDHQREKRIRHGSSRYINEILQLVGRPLELVERMMAESIKRDHDRHPNVLQESSSTSVDLNELLKGDERARLESGLLELQAYHPYLDTLTSLSDAHSSDPSHSSALLLTTVIYLAAPPSSPADQLRADLRLRLAPHIMRLRSAVMLHIPESFSALQALDLLAVHAPLGALPLQLVDPGETGLPRGQRLAASRIADTLQFANLFKILALDHITNLFNTPDIWLHMCFVADEGSVALGDEVPKRPDGFEKAVEVAVTMLLSANEGIWRDGLRPGSITALLGKLLTCSRLGRLREVYNGMAEMSSALGRAAREPDSDLVGLVTAQLRLSAANLEATDSRVDNLIAMIASINDSVPSSWLVYRKIRQQSEDNKLYDTAIQIIVASHKLFGSSFAVGELPLDPMSRQRLSQAMALLDTRTLIPFLSQSPLHPAVKPVSEWRKRRCDKYEQILVAVTDLGDVMAPLDEIACIAVDSAKGLMEMLTVASAIGRNEWQSRASTWFFLMKQVSIVLRGIADRYSSDRVDERGSVTILGGCSQLIGSMVHTEKVWAEAVESMEQRSRSTNPMELSP